MVLITRSRAYSFPALLAMFLCWNCKGVQWQRKKIGNEIVEGIFLKDSIYDGKADVYNDNGILIASRSYFHGLVHGVAKHYFSNGKMADSVNYRYGLINGFHYEFEIDGKLKYADYYVNGLAVGPQTFFKDGRCDLFYFLNFENIPLYEAHYDSLGRIDKFKGQIVNVHPYRAVLNGMDACGVFAFLVHPPSLNIRYSLVVRNPAGDIRKVGIDLSAPRVFIDTVIQSPPDGYKYHFMADYSDTLNGIHRVYTNELNYSDSTEEQ